MSVRRWSNRSMSRACSFSSLECLANNSNSNSNNNNNNEPTNTSKCLNANEGDGTSEYKARMNMGERKMTIDTKIADWPFLMFICLCPYMPTTNIVHSDNVNTNRQILLKVNLLCKWNLNEPYAIHWWALTLWPFIARFIANVRATRIIGNWTLVCVCIYS